MNLHDKTGTPLAVDDEVIVRFKISAVYLDNEGAGVDLVPVENPEPWQSYNFCSCQCEVIPDAADRLIAEANAVIEMAKKLGK